MDKPVIEVRSMRMEDGDAAREIVCKEYMVMEPMGNSLKMDPIRDGNTWFDSVFPACLEDGLSVVAIDTATGRMAGIRLSGIVYKDKKDVYHFDKDDPNTRSLALIYESVDALYKGINIFEKYGVVKYVNFRCVCVAKDYQRQGIGTKMVAKCLDLIKEKNFRVVTVEASSRYSAHIFQKFGFEKLVEHRYETTILDGEPLPMTDELRYHDSHSLYVKVM